MSEPFVFGRQLASQPNCCTKPVGCNMTHDGCLFLKHPWKRAMVFHDPTVRCQAKTGCGDQCVLLNGHAEDHDLGPSE